MICGMVSSGSFVGMEIRSMTLPSSSPMAQTILVPPPSSAPKSITVLCLAPVLV